jgi:Na+/H+ antiporter NhaC
MEQTLSWGIWSLLPLLVALLIAFRTRSAVFSLFCGALIGVVLLSFNPDTQNANPLIGLNSLFQSSLGNADFIWICLIVCQIGILFEIFRSVGVITAFTDKVSSKANTQKSVGFTAWLLGFAIVDDYFSPLLTGAIMRPLSDKVKMSREKLAFILDSTTSSVCILVPILAWGTMMTGLIKAQGGPVTSIEQAFMVFTYSIPYNFYSILLLVFSLGIVLKIIPDFGPMRKAEARARETGKLYRDGANPLISAGPDDDPEHESSDANLLFDFLIPISILFGSILIGLWVYSRVMIVESFMAAILYSATALLISGKINNIEHLSSLVTKGIQEVMPAILIIALAYCINGVTKELGAAIYITQMAQDSLTPSGLLAVTFLLTALFAFSTGTSWGAYALMIPLALPIAYSFNGGQIDALALQTIAAVAGGGIFGDHASPVSDTTVLASAGAGSDHMDHVITQLPYALVVAIFSLILYLAL